MFQGGVVSFDAATEGKVVRALAACVDTLILEDLHIIEDHTRIASGTRMNNDLFGIAALSQPDAIALGRDTLDRSARELGARRFVF